VLVLMLLRLLTVFCLVVMRMSVAGQAPDEKAHAREHQDCSDYVTLLGLDLLLKLQPDNRYDAAEGRRSEHVTCRGEGAHPGQADQAPVIGPGDHSEGNPMIGKKGVNHPDSGAPDQEQDYRTQTHLSTMLPESARI
jgi:hypothetical protein